MSVTVETAKLIVGHLKTIVPDVEIRRSYLPFLKPDEFGDDDKIVINVVPFGRDAERYTQGGMQKHELAIDICINAKLVHRNDEYDALLAEIDELVAFAEKIYALFLKKVVVNAEHFRATFDQPEHIVLIDNDILQKRNCFLSAVRVNAEVYVKPEV